MDENCRLVVKDGGTPSILHVCPGSAVGGNLAIFRLRPPRPPYRLIAASTSSAVRGSPPVKLINLPFEST
jgi:hypothetical protein